MTQIAAIAIRLIKGDVLDIGIGFRELHCSNLPRELSRGIEQKFGVTISKTEKKFKSVYDGRPGYYFAYRLNKSEHNLPGIEKMKEYVREQLKRNPPKTSEQEKIHRRTQMVLDL